MAALRYALIFERTSDSPPAQVVREHRDRLRRLAGEGTVALAGPFEGGGGLVVLDVETSMQAERIAREDPFITHATHRYRLVRWLQDIGVSQTGSEGG